MVEMMPKLFATDFCRSGMCIKDQFIQKCAMAREVSDEKDQLRLHRESEELLAMYIRMADEQDTHFNNGAS
jgi:hypothetical protein